MVAKKDTNRQTAARNKERQQEQPKAATTVFRVVCLLAAIGLLVLDAMIPTFDYPVWVLGLLMGVVIGLGPEDLRDWFKGKGR